MTTTEAQVNVKIVEGSIVPRNFSKQRKRNNNQNKSKQNLEFAIPNIQIRGIEANKLISSQDYQRPINKHNVSAIKNDYCKELVNPVKVSLRGGKYYVFDGQHTLTVLIDMFGEQCIIPCIVYNGLTYEREAELFAKQDEFKKKLSARDNYIARRESNDKDILKFESILKDEGFSVGFGGSKGPLTIGNVKYMYGTVYTKKGENHLREILKIIKKAYSDEPNATRDDFVKGLDAFICKYTDSYDFNRLTKVLQNISPTTICRNAKADMVNKGPERFSIQIFDLYNKGLRSGKLTPA